MEPTESQKFRFDGGGLYEPMEVTAPDQASADAYYVANRVPLPPKECPLLCDACGMKVGSISFPCNDPRDIESMLPAELGYSETYCDEHKP